jgi:4-amino-4-deoxy-L-arabinose transferase-like glycosyltransferase
VPETARERPGLPGSSGPLKGAVRPALFVVTVATFSAASMLLRGRIPFTSDQAIVYLMGMEIWLKGAHPVFYYGSAYAGTVEPHLLALVGGLLGPSRLTYFLFTGTMTVVAVLLAWMLARRVFGARAGLFGGLYLALGPSYFFYKGLTSDGAYMSLTICLGVALLGLVSITLREGPAIRVDALWLGAIGLATGLAWWILPLSVALGPAALLAVSSGRREVWRSIRSWALLIATFLLGSAPWWAWNVEHGWAALKAPEIAATGPDRFVTAAVSFFFEGWPTIIGARSVWTDAPTIPLAEILSWAVLALLVASGRLAVRGLPTRSARLAGMMLGIFAFSPLALSFAIRRTDFSEPRYLVPIYLVLPAFIGALLARLESRRLLSLGIIAVLMVLGIGSQLRARKLKDGEDGIFRNPYSEIKWLESKGLRHVYTPYWSAYRLILLSGGQVIATPFGTGELGFQRHLEYRKAVDADPAPGFLLDSYDMPRFKRYLVREKIAHRVEFRQGHWLFTGLPPSALSVIRRCNCIPAAPRPGDITWLGLYGPRTLAAEEIGEFRLDVRNTSRLDFQRNVIVGTRWRRIDGSEAVPEAGWAVFTEGLRMARDAGPTDAMRAFGGSRNYDFISDLMENVLTFFRWAGRKPAKILSDGLLSGAHEEIALRLKAPDAPGEYDLVVDLVDRDVTWFEWAGLKPMTLRVKVRSLGASRGSRISSPSRVRGVERAEGTGVTSCPRIVSSK